MISFQTSLASLDESNVYGRCVFVPQEHIEELRSWSSKRFLCTLNEQETIHCALLSAGNGNYFILMNKALCKKLKVDIGDPIAVNLIEDTSKYGMYVPEEFTQALKLDPQGDALFHALTIGKQRNLIHVVGVPKSSEIRIKKALVILEHLKTTGGVLDFKALNQAMKEANRSY